MKNGFATENDWYVKNFISGNIFVIRTSFCCLHRGFVQKDITQDRKKSSSPCSYLLCNTSIVSTHNNNSNIFFISLGAASCSHLIMVLMILLLLLWGLENNQRACFSVSGVLFIENLELDALKVNF